MVILLIHENRQTALDLCKYVSQCYPTDTLRCFTRSKDALEFIENCPVPISLCFTAVVLPGTSGFQIARTLREHTPHAKIVFLSDTREYALDAWRASASDYLLEPITLQSVQHTRLTCQ